VRNKKRRENFTEEKMKAIRNSQGFTLIELLVVVAIIGILAAIAIPQFASYRQRGFDSRAESDLRNAATAEEAYYASNQSYNSTTDASCSTDLPGCTISAGVKLAMTANGASFTGTSTHPGGSGKTWNYDSTKGGIQ
jgi:type IV pilus assembly protein PilA